MSMIAQDVFGKKKRFFGKSTSIKEKMKTASFNWICFFVLGMSSFFLVQCGGDEPSQEQIPDSILQADASLEQTTIPETSEKDSAPAEEAIQEESPEEPAQEEPNPPEPVVEVTPEPVQEEAHTPEKMLPEPVPEQVNPEKSPALSQKLDLAVQREMTRQKLVGAAIGVVRKGKIIHMKGYGFADRENKIPVVANKTMFRWASISKTIAGIVAVRLHFQKALDLDASISKYYTTYKVPTTYVEKCNGKTSIVRGGRTYKCSLGFFTFPIPTAQQKITSRMLGGHLGGISHYSNGKGSPSPSAVSAADPKINTGMEWAMKNLVNRPLIAVPGSKYSYTTFGFNLLGVVLEKAGKRSFHDMAKDQIFKPAGMTTMQPDYEWTKIPNRAVGYYSRTSNGKTSIFRQGSSDVSWKLAGGGFISTLEDMARYCQSLMGNKVLTDAMKKVIWTRQKTTAGKSISYGIGFSVSSSTTRPFVAHTGSQEKTKTFLYYFLKEETCLVGMTNSTYANVSSLRNVVDAVVRFNP